MAQQIRDPQGEVHEFPDEMPPDQIHAAMTAKWTAKNTSRPGFPSAAPAQPPGTRPGGMQPQTNAPESSMAPLSEDAERYKRMMTLKTMQGDRAGVTGATNLLHSDPSYVHQQEQAKKMGTDAATLAAKQGAGTRVYSALNELEQKSRAWLDHAPSAFNAATGEYYSNPYVQLGTGWANQGGQAFHRLLSHDIAKLTALYREMPSSGRGSGSDAQDANFKEAMGEFVKAKTPEQYFAIMQSAKQLIRDKAGLPHDFDLPYAPLHPADVAAVSQYASRPIGSDSPYVTGKKPEAQRPRQQFRSKESGKIEDFEWDGSKWNKVQ